MAPPSRGEARRPGSLLPHGIGLHVGDEIAGSLDSSRRLAFTVAGASLDGASRLARFTCRFPQQPVLISVDLLASSGACSPASRGTPEPG